MDNEKKVVAFGTILKRLPFHPAAPFYGGAELTVLRSLSGLGHRTDMITAAPSGEMECLKNFLNKHKINDSHILQREGSFGSYSFNGQDPSFPEHNTRLLDAYVFTKNDYDEIFKDCSIFYFTGISLALSPALRDLCFVCCQEARKRNVKVCFDLQYKENQWNKIDARSAYLEAIRFTDILFCMEQDLQDFFNTSKECFHQEYTTRYLITLSVRKMSGNVYGLKSYMKERVFENNRVHYCVATNHHTIPFTYLYVSGAYEAFVSVVLHHILQNNELCLTFPFAVANYVRAHSITGDEIPLDEVGAQPYVTALFLTNPFSYYELPDAPLENS